MEEGPTKELNLEERGLIRGLLFGKKITKIPSPNYLTILKPLLLYWIRNQKVLVVAEA